MADSAAVASWLGRYVDVWRSGDHDRVAELFSDDAVYYTDPFRLPRRGLAEIEEYWRASGDPPDAFEAHYEPLAVITGVAVAAGFSRYFDQSRSHIDKEYANVFVLSFAADGRCAEYREWFMLRGEPEPASIDAAGDQT